MPAKRFAVLSGADAVVPAACGGGGGGTGGRETSLTLPITRVAALSSVIPGFHPVEEPAPRAEVRSPAEVGA